MLGKLKTLYCKKKLFCEPEDSAPPPQVSRCVCHINFFVLASLTCSNYLPPVVQQMHGFHGKELLLAADSILSVALSRTPLRLLSEFNTVCSTPCLSMQHTQTLCPDLSALLVQYPPQTPHSGGGPVAACSTKLRPTFLTGSTKLCV